MKLITFAGFRHSGKSEATKILLARGFRELKMADPLKDMLRALYSYSDYSIDEIEERIEGSLKEIEDPFLGCTPRHAMQQLGTEWRLSLKNVTLWSDIWSRRAKYLLDNHINCVCGDIRFDYEVTAVHRAGGRVYWIDRGLSSDGHVSETDISDRCDGVIANHSSIEEFHRRVQKL